MADLHPVFADLYRYHGRTDWREFVNVWLVHRGFRFMVWHRLTARSRRPSPAWLLFRLLMERAKTRYGIDISSRADIGPGLHISHFGAIVIGPTSLGADCNITKGVTIGNISNGPRPGRPVLGHGVWVGANATIVGGITVGDGAAIAPGAYVNFDVPPRALVLGNPGIIVGEANPAYVRHRTGPAGGGLSG